LLESILATGDRAVEPLLAVLRSNPRGWPSKSVLDPVIGLLRMLSPPSAIPMLIEVVKSHKDETSGEAADALVDFGDAGFDALVHLCNESSIRGYERTTVFEIAARAAGTDPARRARVADAVRPILEERIAAAREELRQRGTLAKLPPSDEFRDDEDDEFD